MENVMKHEPVCGMPIEEKHAAGKSEFRGKTYYFCSTACKAAFEKEPDKYAHDVHTGSEHH